DNVPIEWPIADAASVANTISNCSAFPNRSSVARYLTRRIRISAGHPKVSIAGSEVPAAAKGCTDDFTLRLAFPKTNRSPQKERKGRRQRCEEEHAGARIIGRASCAPGNGDVQSSLTESRPPQ